MGRGEKEEPDSRTLEGCGRRQGREDHGGREAGISALFWGSELHKQEIPHFLKTNNSGRDLEGLCLLSTLSHLTFSLDLDEFGRSPVLPTVAWDLNQWLRAGFRRYVSQTFKKLILCILGKKSN